MSAFSERLNLDPQVTSKAELMLSRGEVAWVVMSGKICSGKDTVAPLLDLPGKTVIISYGSILREKLTLALDSLRLARYMNRDEEFQVNSLRRILELEDSQAQELLMLLDKEFEVDENVSSYGRTDNMRYILQKLGSDWLPHPDFLPRLAAVRAIEVLENGDSVVAAGSRFLPDVEIPKLAGGFTVRLDVNRKTQLRRLESRDNLTMTNKLLDSLNHPGEIALDDYPHDIRVDNNDDSPGQLTQLMDMINVEVRSIIEKRKR